MKIAVGILKWSWWRGRNSLDVCLHLCWELHVKYIQHCTCTAAPRGMLLKGKSVMPLLSSLPAPSPLTQADTHTSLPRPLLAALLAPPPPLLPPFSPSPAHSTPSTPASLFLEPLRSCQFSAGCSLCPDSFPITSPQLVSFRLCCE